MRPKQAQIVIKGLQQDKTLKDKYKNAYKEIEAFLKKKEQKNNNKNSKPQEDKTSGEQPKPIISLVYIKIVLSTTQKGSFSVFSYSLINSFILDCSSPVYICNDLDRFDSAIF